MQILRSLCSLEDDNKAVVLEGGAADRRTCRCVYCKRRSSLAQLHYGTIDRRWLLHAVSPVKSPVGKWRYRVISVKMLDSVY